MSTFHWEEEKFGKGYDPDLMRRLLHYVKPYKGLFLLAVGLVLCITAIDLSLPFITKTAIDQHIVLPHAAVDTAPLDADQLPDRWQERFGALRIGEDRYLVDTNRLDEGTRLVWKNRGALAEARYVVLGPEASPELRALAQGRPEVFSRSGEAFYAPARALDALPPAELARLRGDNLQGVVTLALLYVGLLVFNFLFSFAQVYVLQYTGQRVMYDLRRDIFSHQLRLPAAFFDRTPVGKLVTRATNDVSAINEMVTAVLVNLFRDVFLIVGILGIMFALNWRLTLLILVLAPVLAAITIQFRKLAREAYREVRRRISMLNAFLQENISGMRIIHLFAQEARNHREFSEINEAKYRAEMRQTLIFAVFNPLISTMSSVAIALIIWYGGGQVVQGLLSLGALVAMLQYVRMLFQPINDLSEKYNILQGAMASSERIFQLLDEEQEDRGRGERLPEVEGRLEFRDVWFAYNQDEWVLRGVSFVVEPGETIAIVGPTGSGKTTVISLLLRLYDIQRGQILLDGVDLRALDVEFLRAQMAVVLQDVFLFSGDILGNIRLQSEAISEEQAIEAARFVHADGFIRQLPGAYGAEVTERGSTLSGGQRQLLSFARAVAFDPKVLVLDEATANIDSQTEQLIQDSLQRILQGRTSIVIAHRLSTIRDADQILVLNHGLLAERGTHDELMHRGGLYAALYELQFAEMDERTGPKPPPEDVDRDEV